MFNIRLITVDHYVSKPLDELNSCENLNDMDERREPVLRIFGTTSEGFKSCVHVHGVYPYIFIPYKGGDNPGRDALLVGAALDEALKISFNPKSFRYVHDVILVSGIPLYGYHSKPRQFFKILFYNPYHIRKASELLLSGAILGQKFQPHEAHIPYALQFMMDYDIYGMSFVTFSKVKYRRNPQNPDCLAGVSEEHILSDKVKKITCSYLEVDAWACDITNRISEQVIGINPGIRAIWEDEKDRRREQRRSSQITVQQSQSRSVNKIYATEALYKVRLAEKLKQISSQEPRMFAKADEPSHFYPAEVSEAGNILEASAVGEGFESFLAKESVQDVSSLIDERVLSQISGSQNERPETESEEDETEDDSVIGRNQKAEEAELEDEEGVDMTQPLNFDEEVICGAAGNRDEPGSSNKDSVEKFWKSMASKIFQSDGAHESSSESEAETTPLPSVSENGVSGASLELSSAWSTNIMSILSEDSGCPVPSTLCQTPRTFWSNYSPNWLPQNQDSWAWNKYSGTLSEFGSKNQNEDLNMGDFYSAPKEYASGEPFDFFASGGGECVLSPAEPPFCSAESTASPLSDILTPGSETGGSDFNLDSVYENFKSPKKDEKCTPDRKSSETKRGFKRKPEDDRQKCLQVLKSFAGKKVPSEDDYDQLTLKQYIKDCEEIVSVDFKNLCNQEMIIIEYKSQSKRSLKNKYLIKPLDKFLESWNTAERKASDRRFPKDRRARKIINGFNVEEGKNLHSAVINVLEKRFSDSSTVQAVSNKLTVKAMEILPNGASAKDRSYNVNQNVISQGKIKMKLIKSQRDNLEENLVESALKRRRNEKCYKLAVNKIKAGKQKAKPEQKPKRENIQTRQMVGKYKKWKNLSEPDFRLINEINSSFEKYFKNIVQSRNANRKNNNLIEGINDDTKKVGEERKVGGDENDVDDDDDVDEDRDEDMSGDERKRPPQNADPVKFVTRFLTAFSRMSDIPPLSITITLGNPRISVPVQVNLQPIATTSDKEVNYFSKKQKSEVILENVDGPADGSSSDGSAGGEPTKRRSFDQKKRRKEGRYKPLNVVICGSPSEKKKRKMSTFNPSEEEKSEGKKGRKCFSTHTVEDRFDVCRKMPMSCSSHEGKKKKTSNQNLVKKKSKGPENLKDFRGPEKPLGESQEQDFIEDSEEERKFSKLRTLKLPKIKSAASLKNIPQADTETFSSSDDEDELKRIRKRILETDKGDSGGKAVETFCNAEKEIRKRMSFCKELSSGFEEVCREKGKKMEISLGRTTSQVESSEQDFRGMENLGESTDVKRISSFTEAFQPTLTLLKSRETRSPSETRVAASKSSALSLLPKNLIPSAETEKSTGSSESAKPSFQESKYFESLKSEDLEISRVPSLEVEISSLDWVIGCKVIRPKSKPLAKEAFYILHDNLLESEDNLPFYSDSRDVTRAVETGPRPLKVKSHSVERLKLFKSSLGLLGVEERRNISTKGGEAKRCRLLVGNEDLRITPLMKPPSSEIASKWLFSKKESGKFKKELEKAKVKLVKPLSLESDDEIDASLTISCFSGEIENSGSTSRVNFSESSFLTQNRNSFNEAEMTCRKRPLIKNKKIKKFSTPKETLGVLEEGQTPEKEKSSDSPPSDEGKRKSDDSFRIRGITLDNSFGFSHSVENMQDAKHSDTHHGMNMLVMELHVQTRKGFCPDPEHDPIRALFYAITFTSPAKHPETGILVVGESPESSGVSVSGHCIHHVVTEKALIEKFLDLVKLWDPDILAGYEIEMHSWGYFVQRGFILEMNLILRLGRVQAEEYSKKNSWDVSSPCDDEDGLPRGVKHLKISGRITLNVWRVLRHELALTSYSFESVIYHLSHERHPVLSYESLSHYWEHPNYKFRHIVIEYYATRVVGIIRILDQLDFVNRTSELSRLFGIQFYEVLSRGSQFRVESMMLRLAKPLNYVSVSPSVTQRAVMRAPASLPLILEPESLFYSDPVVVLDFQSLYPSIIIAYNYCFSTCLGRVENLGGREPFEFGCTQLQISPEELRALENDLSISPAGVAFVKPNIRKGILPTMLEEILETRLMVKKSMKENRENKILQKVLFARQLGLKLIANVTYGYAAANFSGRMPCIEVGDSVVSKGRETLHRAIQLVKNTRKWGAKVVYGDTDSIFVLVPGRSREEAFKIGREIADAVTQDNPKPVKLKLEKVYQPSILQTKKRYLGYMFETPDQEKPIFEAKGIETVRRDGCPAVGKILRKALQILFDTRDISLVKKYTIRQFAKVFQGRINMQDLIFAKEYRGRNGYRPGACVPALYLARKWTRFDKRAEPRVKERVPYVIVNGPPGVPLIQLVRSPKDLISDASLSINAMYYIIKAIVPPMQRCFSLLGVDVAAWVGEIPRKCRRLHRSNWTECQKRNTISQYFATVECVVCCEVTNSSLCSQCEKHPQGSVLRLSEKVRLLERCHEGLLNICRSCCGRSSPLECVSLDCPVIFRRMQAERALEQGPVLREILTRYL